MLDMYMCIYVYISKYKQYIKETEVGSKQSNNIIPVITLCENLLES